MSGLGRVIVGYREGSRKLAWYLDNNIPVTRIRSCAAGCGAPVWVNASGLAAMHDKDPEVVCEPCAAVYHPELKAEL